MGRVSSLVGKLTLLCMQFLRGAPADEAEAALRRWQQLMRSIANAADAQDASLQLVHYIATIAPLSRDRVLGIVAPVKPHAEAIFMKTYGLVQEEALREGIALGEAKLLVRQLEARFGPLTDDTLARVRAAAPAGLERWAVAVLTAPTLAAVFATN